MSIAHGVRPSHMIPMHSELYATAGVHFPQAARPFVTFTIGKVLTALLICGNVVMMSVIILQGEIIVSLEGTISLQEELILSKERSISLQDEAIARNGERIAGLERELGTAHKIIDIKSETIALHEERIAWLERELGTAHKIIDIKSETIALLSDSLGKAGGVVQEYAAAYGACEGAVKELETQLLVCQTGKQRPKLWAPWSPFPWMKINEGGDSTYAMR